MIGSFAFRQAARETRASWRRLGLYMSSITLGVAALVAINSFRANVQDSVGASARELLGADMRLRSNTPFPAPVQQVIDSMGRAGHPAAYAINLVSMALAPRSGLTRLVQVRGIDPQLPLYGRYETTPAIAWQRLRAGQGAVVDPAILVQLGIRVGDTLAVGFARFPVVGTIQSAAGDMSLQTAVGPRVFVPRAELQRTGLLTFGSLARYEAYFRVPSARERQRFDDGHREAFRSASVGLDTAEHVAEEVTEALSFLSRFLGLVGLAALLLGGVGVASAIHVFIKGRLDTVAVLRCLGATQRSVFGAYLLQSGFMGLAGAAAGAILGVAVQAVLPQVLSPFLAVDVPFALSPLAIAAGLATGVWVAGMFALIPLLGVRDVAPLQALRHDFEPPRRRADWRRAAAYLLLVASILALSLWQAPNARLGLAFALGLATVALVLWGIAVLLARATRRFFPASARYVVRQGISNLFRPHNQTVAITLSLGFGIFLVATLYLVHGAILDRVAFGTVGARANLLLFDVQPTQLAGVRSILASAGAVVTDVAPIVPARIQAINGRPAQEILATLRRRPPGERGRRGRPQGGGPAQPEPWALRHEYRNTYRAGLMATEQLTAGKWWRRSAAPPVGGPALISLDEELARNLAVGVGDTITWDFHGVLVPSVIASLRKVEWARFSPNFFVVFQPGTIDSAPQTIVALARVPGGDMELARVQGDLVRSFPNVSTLDLSLVQRTLDSIVGKVTMAIRFLALFSVGAGLIVLIGALATSRFQRMRESALLKTLGARRRQVLQVLFTEYAALGLLAGLAGTLLALAGAWGVVHFMFGIPFRPPVLALVASWLGVAVLTVVVGLLNSREVLRRSPLAVLREAE